MKYHPKTKPFKHQSRATIAAAKHRNYGIFMEPRLGKSKAALDYCGILALKGEVRRVLILAPRIALNVWEKEIEKHFPFSYHAESFDEEWSSTVRGSSVSVQFFLAGREETWRATRRGKKLYRPKQKEVEAWNPDVVIFDESHQYKRPGGRGAQDAWRFVRRLRVRNGTRIGPPWVILLSGTPNPKGWRDLFAQFRIMDETIFGSSASAFDRRHVIYGHGKRRYTILAYRGEAKILKKVRRHSISVSAEEAGLQGKRFWNPITVSLPAKAMTAYVEMIEHYVTEVNGEVITAKNQGVLRTRLLQITGGFTTSGGKTHDAKLGAARAYMELVAKEQAEQMVVGARYLPEVHALGENLKQMGIEHRIIEGATRRTRNRAIQEFQRGRVQVLVFQVAAGAAAIDLSCAAEMLLYSLPDGWVEFKQFCDRLGGPNQTRPVRYTPILARGTLDRNVIRGLIRKEDWHSTMMNDPDRFLRGLIQ